MKKLFNIIITITVLACVALDIDLAVTNYNKGDIGMMILSIMAGILCSFVAGLNIHDIIRGINKKIKIDG
jgi:hypothetical protein